MNVLGLSCYSHDAAACLVSDGKIIAAAEEERFTRRKHDASFPLNAIRFCLEQGKITPSDLDGVAFYEKPLSKLERGLVGSRQCRPPAKDHAAWHLDHFLRVSSRLDQTLAETIGYHGKVLYLEHHLSHAASAFLPSPFERAAILTVDGVGEWASTALFVGNGSDIRKLREIRYPHSLGLFYSAITAFLGFEVNEGEYKLMGMASYGQPRHQDLFSPIIRLHDDGSFSLDQEYFSFAQHRDGMYSDAYVRRMGIEPRRPEDPISQYHMDLAASAQKVAERAMLNLVKAARDLTGADSLCLAGGIAHNVVANSAIRHSGLFERMFIQPAAGDSGTAIGSALYGWHRLSGGPRVQQPYDTCLGPEFDDESILAALDEEGLAYDRLPEDELCRQAAKLISQDFVIGWFQGRMEFGPRALGNRSILANPRNAAMKDIVNRRIKFREPFRPFAPAVLEERADEFFALAGPSPFMLYAPNVHAHSRGRIPAVTHVDGTARVQTVDAARSPRFRRLLTELDAVNGVPMTLNTSFNVRGEPIVCAPADAIRCFLHTDMDFLFIGSFLVRKS